jgi:hypothetical protein
MTATIRLWVAAIGAVLAMAALAHADIDTDSASQLHPTSSAEARPVYGREEADPVFRPA